MPPEPKRRRLPFGLMAAGAGLTIAVALAVVPLAKAYGVWPEARVRIDPSLAHQTIDGWEATVRLWEYDKRRDRYDDSWAPLRDQLLQAAIGQAGITRLRLEIRSGAENPVDYWEKFRSRAIGYEAFKSRFYEKINDNDDPRRANPAGFQFSQLDFYVETVVLPARRLAAARGRRLSVVLTYVDFGWTKAQGTLSHADRPEEYAELVDLTFRHLKNKYGLTPDALELVLEPDNTDRWRGSELGDAAVAVTRRLKADGFAPALIAPSVAHSRKAVPYFNAMVARPGAAGLVSTLSYHRYDWPKPRVLKRIRRRAEEAGLRTAMLEHTDGGLDELLDDLTVADVSAWQSYALACKAEGAGDNLPGCLAYGRFDGARRTVGLTAHGLALSQLFRFVEPGAVRIDTASDHRQVRAAAFRNPDGRLVLVVKDGRRPIRVDLAGLPAGRYVLHRIRAGEARRERGELSTDGAGLTLRLSAGETATLVQAPSGAVAVAAEKLLAGVRKNGLIEGGELAATF